MIVRTTVHKRPKHNSICVIALVIVGFTSRAAGPTFREDGAWSDIELCCHRRIQNHDELWFPSNRCSGSTDLIHINMPVKVSSNIV